MDNRIFLYNNTFNREAIITTYITKNIYRVKGENKSNSKLKERDVIQIKKLLSQNVSSTEIAKWYNVSNGLIQHIKKGRAWKYLK